MPDGTPPAPVVRHQTELRRGAVGLWEAVFQSFSFVAPAGDVAVLLVGTTLFAVGATPLAVLIGWVIYGIWMIVPTEFSRRIVNAGSYYAYSARGLNGAGGVLAVWYWAGENLTGPAFGVLGLSGFVYLISTSISHTGWAWAPIAVVVLLYGTILSYLGIRPSLVYTMWSGFAETAFLLISAIIIIVELGTHNTPVVFTTIPVHGNLSLLFFGVIFSILDFTGLGTATTVSEEARDSRKLVRRGILLAWIFAGLALILPSYALTVGWGVGNMAGYGKAPDPGLIVYQRYLGTAGWLLLIIFTINSYLMYIVAKVNAVTRIWYSAGRDGVLFGGLAKIHPRFRTPHLAIAFFFVAVFVIDLIAGALLGPTDAVVWLSVIAGICIIGTHIIANTALTAFMIREGGFNVVLHGIAPAVATVAGLIVLFFSVYPIPSGPDGKAVIVGLLWLLVGFGVMAYYAMRHPDLLKVAGQSRE